MHRGLLRGGGLDLGVHLFDQQVLLVPNTRTIHSPKKAAHKKLQYCAKVLPCIASTH